MKASKVRDKVEELSVPTMRKQTKAEEELDQGQPSRRQEAHTSKQSSLAVNFFLFFSFPSLTENSIRASFFSIRCVMQNYKAKRKRIKANQGESGPGPGKQVVFNSVYAVDCFIIQIKAEKQQLRDQWEIFAWHLSRLFPGKFRYFAYIGHF
jgi:hypothetical protein